MTPPPLPQASSDLPPRYGSPISLATAKRVMAAAEAEANRHGWQAGQDVEVARAGADALAPD